MVYIPELVIQWEQGRIIRLKERARHLISMGNVLPSFLQDTINYCNKRQSSAYDIVRKSDSQLFASVTGNWEVSRVTHDINLTNVPPTCSRGCLRLLGTPCIEMCIYAHSVHIKMEDILPNKFQLQTHLELLNKILPEGHSTLNITKESLACTNHPVILPPFIRKPPGRPTTRRFKKGHRPKQVHVCRQCGMTGHDMATCNTNTDGLGNMMSADDQDVTYKRGYLVITIGLPGNTCLPKTLEEFETMRANSELAISSYKNPHNGNFRVVPEVAPVISIPTPPPQASTLQSTDEVPCVEESLNNAPEEHWGCDHDKSDRCFEDLDTDSESTVYPHINSDDDSSCFDYPSDISHYTLDQTKKLCKSVRLEHQEWHKEKKEASRLWFMKKDKDPYQPPRRNV